MRPRHEVKTLAIVQARMSSTRLPGKVLAPIMGEPMIIQQLERISRADSLDAVVVATSTHVSDDPLVQVLESAGYRVVRGQLEDVLSRFLQAIELFQPESVVRLTADCPLISPTLIDEAVKTYQRAACDYLSNTLIPSYPDGLDVEVVRAESLVELGRITLDKNEREHVTLGIYRRPKQFRLQNLVQAEDLSALRWTVDNHEDLEFARLVYERLYVRKPDFETSDILSILAHEGMALGSRSTSGRNSALDGLDTGVMIHPSSSKGNPSIQSDGGED